MTKAKIEIKALTTGEVAKYCDVNFRTVIRWIERGVLEAYQLPGRGDNRVPVKAFIKFLKENQMPIPEDFISVESAISADNTISENQMETNNKVLIIDDQEEMARTIARVLKRLGYQTEIAENGFIAGVLLLSYKPALVTLDLRMPGLNGFDVLKFIKGREELNALKVLIISGEKSTELEKAISEGADDALAKPFNNQDLEEKVKRLFEN